MKRQKLKDSALWRDSAQAAEEYPTITGSMMEAMVSTLVNRGNGMGWMKDGTLSEWGPRLLRGAHEVAVPDADPVLNPLYAQVPVIDDDRFLKVLASDPDEQRLDGREVKRNRYAITEGAPGTEIPLHAEVHHIAAAAMVMKHFMAHPERLTDYYPREGQVAVARKTLNACFEIVVLRGIEDDFAASCAEFAAVLDEMTAISPWHKAKMDEVYETALRVAREMEERFGVKPDARNDGKNESGPRRKLDLVEFWLKDVKGGPKPE